MRHRVVAAVALAMVSADGQFQQRLSSDKGDVREAVMVALPVEQRVKRDVAQGIIRDCPTPAPRA
jgi:hypothetical protein